MNNLFALWVVLSLYQNTITTLEEYVLLLLTKGRKILLGLCSFYTKVYKFIQKQKSIKNIP